MIAAALAGDRPVRAGGGDASEAIRLVAIVAADDARKAIAIGAGGEVYEPDGNGSWLHKLASRTADPIAAAGRAGSQVIASGNGVVYRLADNGWTAIRLVQHGKAILGSGTPVLAAVGRQLFALDAPPGAEATSGEPARLATAPANIVAIGSGAKAVVVATDSGAFRLTRTGAADKLVPLPSAPAHLRLISDRWAVTDRGAFDLTTSKLAGWPAGLAIQTAAATADEALAAIGSTQAGLELITLKGGGFTRDPLGIAGTAVGVVVDRTGGAAVALSDGRIALRSRTGWSVVTVADAPASAHPGAPPAASN